MKRFNFYRACTFFFLLFFPGMYAQTQNVVNYQILVPEKIRAGDTVQVVVSFDVANGWFTYAPTKGNRLQKLQLTEAKIIQLPALFRKAATDVVPTVKFANGHEVYTGKDNRFQFVLQTDKDISSGHYEIEVEFSYQACSVKECFAPVTENKKISLVISEEAIH